MEDFNYQGKRKDQVEFSEKIIGWCIIGMILIVCVVSLYNAFSNL